MSLGRTTPILRIFDEAKAKEFYVGFLGFKVDWEHRFERDLPLYMQVSRDGCVPHLCYKNARPGIQAQPWGNDMSVADPFGNRLIFTDVKRP